MAVINLSQRDCSDLRMVAWGAYAPITGFVGHDEHRSIVANARLTTGELWPFPIAPALHEEAAAIVRGASSVDLRDPCGNFVARVIDAELYLTDPRADVVPLFGTANPEHPGVLATLRAGPWRLGGRLEVDQEALALRPPFNRHPARPADVLAIIAERGWRSTVFFQTRNPMHRAHEYLTKCALETVDGLVIHPLVGETKRDDVPAEIRLRCYEAHLEGYYPHDRALLALFAAPMRYAGPREALLHALVRRNFGATHFIVGRDHAGVGAYYGPYEAQQLLLRLDPAVLGITPVPFEQIFYCRACAGMGSAKTCPHDPTRHVDLSGTRMRQILSSGEMLPAEFSRPEIASILAAAYRSRI